MAEFGKGGVMQLPNAAARDLIPAARRVEGMQVWGISEQKSWRLIGGILNSNWQEIVTPVPAWGAISGTISSQTDLNTALSSMVNNSDSRLSDARTPTAHNQAATTITGLSTVATTGSYSDLINIPASINSHLGDTNNPHSTYAAQTGSEPTIGYPTVDDDCLKRKTPGSGGAWTFGTCGGGGGGSETQATIRDKISEPSDAMYLLLRTATGAYTLFADGTQFFINDANENQVFRVDSTGAITTITGSLVIK
jgi:hypothetical protein